MFTSQVETGIFFCRERAQVLTKDHQFFVRMATGFGQVAYKSSQRFELYNRISQRVLYYIHGFWFSKASHTFQK
jgi:hypothetical protein